MRPAIAGKFTIHPLNCGTIAHHPRGDFLYRTRCCDLHVDAPCLAWLLRDGRHNVLVDAGPGARADAPFFYAGHKEPGEHLLAAELARHGLALESIETVVLTHLHIDHVGGARYLPKARFYVQKSELHEAVWPVPFQRPIYQTNQLGQTPAWTAILDRMEVLDGDAELLPGLRVVLLPGHTAGSQGVLVDTEAGQYLIAGDLVPLFDNWPGREGVPIPNGNHTDLRAYDASFDRLKSLGVRILPGHDPLVLETEFYPPA